jgi:hypothetical protein
MEFRRLPEVSMPRRQPQHVGKIAVSGFLTESIHRCLKVYAAENGLSLIDAASRVIEERFQAALAEARERRNGQPTRPEPVHQAGPVQPGQTAKPKWTIEQEKQEEADRRATEEHAAREQSGRSVESAPDTSSAYFMTPAERAAEEVRRAKMFPSDLGKRKKEPPPPEKWIDPAVYPESE